MPPTPETRAMVLAAAEICEDKKGTDIRILELDPMDAGFTDFFLIASASNTRQTGAIADEIELRLKREFAQYARSVEGRRQGEWILLDYVDFVVHIFTEQTREFYDIERLRKSARSVASHELAAELNKKTAAARKKAPAKQLPSETSPAGSLSITLDEGETPSAKKAHTKSVPKKSSAKKAAKKAPAKKAAAKKAAPKKAAKKGLAKAPARKRAASVEDLSPRALPSSRASKQLPPPQDE